MKRTKTPTSKPRQPNVEVADLEIPQEQATDSSPSKANPKGGNVSRYHFEQAWPKKYSG